MDASNVERDIAYRRIHGVEARMPRPTHRGEDPSPCCAWLVRLCRCFSGDSDDSQETTPRSRALEPHYEAPAMPSSSTIVVQQQRVLRAYEDDADAGPLLPKTAESSAPLPRPGHSRNNSSASATVAAAAAAATASSNAPAGGGGGGLPGCSGSSMLMMEHIVLGGASKRPSSQESHLGLSLPPGPGPAAGGAGGGEGLRPSHHRTGSYGEAFKQRWSKGDSGALPAAAETSASGAGNAVASSTAAGRPGAVFGPVQDEDEDFCPTCLDAYTEENPKIFTECGHHFHLPCIYAWLERKDTCPICESPMQAPGVV